MDSPQLKAKSEHHIAERDRKFGTPLRSVCISQETYKYYMGIRQAATALFEWNQAVLLGVLDKDESGNVKRFAALGAALYGDDDARVQALRPKPPLVFRVGDWVTLDIALPKCYLIIEKTSYGAMAYEYESGQRFSGYHALIPSPDYRHAAPDEIKAARGEV